MTKRNYRNNLNFIASAIRACFVNANDLVVSAKLLLENNQNGLALSASVLALEELGKLYCVDGLLFARNDGYKADAFVKSMKSHAHKLAALELFPFLIGQFVPLDPRHRNDERFARAMAISVSDLNQRGNAVKKMLGHEGFIGLDQWKQSGFYSRPKGDEVVAPRQAVGKDIAEAVHALAWRAVTTLDFLLKDEGLDRYIGFARAVRCKLSEDEHKELEEKGGELFSQLFCSDEDEASEGAKRH